MSRGVCEIMYSPRGGEFTTSSSSKSCTFFSLRNELKYYFSFVGGFVSFM